MPHPEPLVSTEQRHRSHTHPSAAAGATPPGIAMAFRHGLTVFLMLLFTLCAFAFISARKSNQAPRAIDATASRNCDGAEAKVAIPRRSSVLWIQWTTVVIFLGIMLLVDLMFLDDSAFVFDPDPVNWRRRTERSY